MSKQNWMPETGALLAPYLTVRDTEATVKLYAEAFGFETDNVMPGPGGKPVHVDMTYQGKTIVMFSPEETPWGSMQAPVTSGTETPIGFYLYCEDVDKQYKQALAAGCEAAGVGDVIGPEDMFWGDRIAVVRDPDGYTWTLATKVGEFDPSKAPKFD